ncbi:MAG: hypothetical protein ACRYGR_05145 [Janthinobacterium lividum]
MKPCLRTSKAVVGTVEHHYHGTVIHRHEAARTAPSVRTREMGTQTDPIDVLEKEAPSIAAQTQAPIVATPAAPRNKWYQRAIDGLRSWFNRHRYIFEVALNVVIFLFNRVNIGISLRPDNTR